jgi:hypothetical protein
VTILGERFGCALICIKSGVIIAVLALTGGYPFSGKGFGDKRRQKNAFTEPEAPSTTQTPAVSMQE